MRNPAWKSRVAAHIVSMLPEDEADAREILTMSERILDALRPPERRKADSLIRLAAENPPG
jgi:DNA-directed RNA polymerase subunit F